jgi:hypothetical protein
MDFNEIFKVRAFKENEEDFYCITIGNHLASTEKFKTAKAAQMKINKTDWNLVASIFAALLKAEKEKETISKNVESKNDK